MDLKHYTKFFNYGYFLSKYEPKILRSLLSATEDVEEINEPLSAGKSEYYKEQVKEKLKSLDDVEKDDLGKGIDYQF